MQKPDLIEKSEKLIALFDTAPIKRAFGMELKYTAEGNAVFNMPYNQSFDHALGGIHGGVISTLLDNAGWFTAALNYDTWIATIDLHVQLIDHAEKTDLVSRGFLVRAGKKIATSRMEVIGANGKLIATGSATFSVTSIPIKR